MIQTDNTAWRKRILSTRVHLFFSIYRFLYRSAYVAEPASTKCLGKRKHTLGNTWNLHRKYIFPGFCTLHNKGIGKRKTYPPFKVPYTVVRSTTRCYTSCIGIHTMICVCVRHYSNAEAEKCKRIEVHINRRCQKAIFSGGEKCLLRCFF